MHDVIIIGGGPAGSHTARRLAQKGCSVLVLEKNTGAGQKLCCTGIVGQECVDTFEIDKKVIIQQAGSAALYSPGGNKISVHRPEPQAAILDRPAFDKSMVERAKQSGAEYRFNSKVTGSAITSDCVTVTTAAGDTLSAKAIVVAGGFSPELNSKLGLGEYKDYVLGAQAYVTAPGLKEVEVYFGAVAPGFFAWLVPAAKDKVRAGLLARADAVPLLKKWLNQLEEPDKVKTTQVQIHYGAVPLKPPTRTCGERMVAVGDAAGQVKPTTGGGIYYGLIGAEIAADVLHRSLEDDDLTAKRLAEYEKAWRRKLGGELRTGYWARKFFERLNESQIDRLFKMIKSGGIDAALLKAKDISFDWHSKTIKSLIKYKILNSPFKIDR